MSVDFSKENAFDKLIEAGFERAKKTLFLWEGVTLYLSESEVRKTIQGVRCHAPAGSILLADFYAERFINLGKKSFAKEILDSTNEGLNFNLPLTTDYEKTLQKFAESESMTVAETYFLGSTSDKGPFMVVAELKC